MLVPFSYICFQITRNSRGKPTHPLLYVPCAVKLSWITYHQFLFQGCYLKSRVTERERGGGEGMDRMKEWENGREEKGFFSFLYWITPQLATTAPCG